MLSADDIEAASKIDASLPAEQKPGLDQLAVDLGQQQFKDHRTTSEHWRVVLSIAQDELLSSSLGEGAPRHRRRALAPELNGLIRH